MGRTHIQNAEVEMLFDPMASSPEGRYVIQVFHAKSGWRPASRRLGGALVEFCCSM